MLYLNSLRALEAVARTGSFVAAAEELGVTPGAVSQKVRQIEAYLGIMLLVRRGRSVELTSAGKLILPDLHTGFAAIEKGWRRLQSQANDKGVSLTLPPSVAARWLLPRLESFRSEIPRSAIHLITTDALLDLEGEGVDLAIRFGPERPDDADAVLLGDEVFLPVCSPDFLSVAGPLQAAPDIKQHRLIHDRTLGSISAIPTWSDWLSAAGVQARDAAADISVDASALAIQAAIGGLGVALMRSLLVADDLASGRLIVAFEKVLPSPFSYFLLRRPGRPRRGPARQLEDWLIAQFAHTRDSVMSKLNRPATEQRK